MKGNDKLIGTLNALLSNELKAINQCMVHAETLNNYKYKRLHDLIQKRTTKEMKHAEKLISHILFLGGIPVVNNLNMITIRKNVEEKIRLDLLAEEESIEAYNRAIQFASEIGDAATSEILKSILHDEENYLDYLDDQLNEVKQMDHQHFLANRVLSAV